LKKAFSPTKPPSAFKSKSRESSIESRKSSSSPPRKTLQHPQMNFGRLYNVNEVPDEAQLTFIKADISPAKQGHLKKLKADTKSKDITSSNIFNLNIQDQSATMVVGD